VGERKRVDGNERFLFDNFDFFVKTYTSVTPRGYLHNLAFALCFLLRVLMLKKKNSCMQTHVMYGGQNGRSESPIANGGCIIRPCNAH